MTSPRIYEDPVGTEEVQEERGISPEETREGLHDVEGTEADPADEADQAEEVSDPGGDSDPGSSAGAS